MQISLYKNASVMSKNYTFECLSKIIKYLNIKGFFAYKVYDEDIHTFDQNNLLLLRHDHLIRQKQIPVKIINKLSRHNNATHNAIKKIHKNMYGIYEETEQVSKVASTTALLINGILDGYICHNGFMQFQPFRDMDKERPIEIEIVFFDWAVKDINNFYCDLCAHVLDADTDIEARPTYFSWASVALKYSHADYLDMRFGAMGYIKDEIISLSQSKGRNICLLGISIAGLTKIMSAKSAEPQ